MRHSRFDGQVGTIMPVQPYLPPSSRQDMSGIADLFVEAFRRDLATFWPEPFFEPARLDGAHPSSTQGVFELAEDEDGDAVDLFGTRYRVGPSPDGHFRPRDRGLIAAMGAVLSMRFEHLFDANLPARMDLYQGSSDDHTIAAFLEPDAYRKQAVQPSRIAATIQALRIAALSTYENRRISTGVLLLGDSPHATRDFAPTPPDALTYGCELSGLKSLHRLCDGERTLLLVDAQGKLAGIVDIEQFAARIGSSSEMAVPCARAYRAHACATRADDHFCLVLSANQEIKLFARGAPAFAYANGRWRLLDVTDKYQVWRSALGNDELAWAIFEAAMNLAERRGGALFVVGEPSAVAGTLIAPQDLLTGTDGGLEPAPLMPGPPSDKRSLHYMARGRTIADLAPTVLESLASLDGAVVSDPNGQLLAFGAILRHEAQAYRRASTVAEGARTTAALVASLHGPVLKVSEDGIISCFLAGERAWDL